MGAGETSRLITRIYKSVFGEFSAVYLRDPFDHTRKKKFAVTLKDAGSDVAVAVGDFCRQRSGTTDFFLYPTKVC